MQVLGYELLEYLEAVLGTRPELDKAARQTAELPLFLRARYDLYATRLAGRQCFLAVEKPMEKGGAPAEYYSHAISIQAKLSNPVALVLPRVPSHTRNRLVHRGVSFIVPGSQMFLPFMGTDLRERFLRQPPDFGKLFTPTAQMVVLFHLLRETLNDVPLQEIASRLGCSAMMLTKAKDELEAANACKVVRRGRFLTLRFQDSKKALWEQVAPLLSSPIKKVHWVIWNKPASPALAAGLTALSKRSMIDDDRRPTYALLHGTVLADLEKGLYHCAPSPEEANTRLEAWRYDPLLLSKGKAVDPLSLYLSLRDSLDERVQQQLPALIETAPW